MKRAPKVLLWLLATPILGLVWLWTSLAIHYSSLPWEWLRTPLAWFVGVGAPIALACLPRRRRPALVLFGTFIMNGYLPEQGYDKGSIRNDLPFEEVMQLSYINEMAVAAGDAPEFSRRIRAHLEDV